MSEARNRFYAGRPARPSGDAGVPRHYRMVEEFIERRTGPGRDYRVLDAGFGGPEFLTRLTRRNPRVAGYGCDISPSRVDASSVGHGIELRVTDLNEDRGIYPESFFDFIVAVELIEHLEDTDNLVSEAVRSLRPGGYFLVTTPNLAAWYERLLLLFGMEPFMAEVSYSSREFGKRPLYRLARREAAPAVGHLRLFTPAALRELGEYHGLLMVEHRGYCTLDFFPNRIVSRLYRNLAQGIFMAFTKP